MTAMMSTGLGSLVAPRGVRRTSSPRTLPPKRRRGALSHFQKGGPVSFTEFVRDGHARSPVQTNRVRGRVGLPPVRDADLVRQDYETYLRELESAGEAARYRPSPPRKDIPPRGNPLAGLAHWLAQEPVDTLDAAVGLGAWKAHKVLPKAINAGGLGLSLLMSPSELHADDQSELVGELGQIDESMLPMSDKYAELAKFTKKKLGRDMTLDDMNAYETRLWSPRGRWARANP